MSLNSDTPISIGISFFNAEKYLIDAIRSIYYQTHKNWELILIDDGSTDDSLKLARSVYDKRIRVISDGENKGLSFRLNQIVKIASYSLIARMDADDIMASNKIQRQIKILNDNPELDLISTNCLSINNNDQLIGKGKKYYSDFSVGELINKKGHGIIHPSIIGRKKWFLRNPYNEHIKIGQDYELWIRAAKKDDFKIFIIDEPLFYYREEMNIKLKKILGAYKTKYNVQLTHNNKIKFFLFLNYKIKIVIVRLLKNLKLFNILLKRRSVPYSRNEKKLFDKNLSDLKSTKLPGIDT